MKKITILLSVPFLFLVLTAQDGCNIQQTERKDRQRTEQTLEEMRSQVGLPNITNYTEAKFARQISELRDQAIRTWTYYIDLNGGRHLLCESIGYGIPYSVQLTNPQKYEMNGATLPQAEPNGLYMPESAEATWILCSDGAGHAAPVYSETRLIVSPFPLGHQTAAQGSGFNERVTVERIDVGAASIAMP